MTVLAADMTVAAVDATVTSYLAAGADALAAPDLITRPARADMTLARDRDAASTLPATPGGCGCAVGDAPSPAADSSSSLAATVLGLCMLIVRRRRRRSMTRA